ncbi:hypothetical protein [Ideonella sp. YS5]|uniref:hypothetical protein n=1 Tax=Ideonella sp. YS5 TaxID=3453714 RepID=UPI003EECFC73
MHPISSCRAAGAALLICSWAAQADTVTPGEVTSWGHPFCEDSSFVRGLAYDGNRYYVADAADHCIDGRPRDDTGRIYIYDRDGNLVKRIPEKPPVRGTFFPHGVATDGIRLWTGDYFGNTLYEYDIATGKLLRSFKSPVAFPIRLDYQASTRTLWLTGYGRPTVFQVRLDGSVRKRISISGYGPNASPAVDGRGDLWVAGIGLDNSARLARYASDSTELQAYASPTPWTALATNINNRAAGYLIDLPLVYNDATGHWDARFQHFSVTTVGGQTDRLNGFAVQCDNLRTGQSTAAHFGGPEHWNCEDGGLAVQPGDQVRVQITGTVR